MNLRMHSHLLAAAVVLGFAAGARAAGPTTHPAGNSPQHAAAEATEVTALRPAFNTLLSADHDYQGHRAKAMRAIAVACRMMGTEIMPAGERPKRGGATATAPATEPEQQTTSDDQLKQAQSTVQQVLTSIPAGTQPRVTERLQEAVSEIGLALAAK